MRYQHCKLILERLYDITSQKKEDTSADLAKINLSGQIKLENVSFSYTKNSDLVLKNINLEIQSGIKIGIVGKSGSGKSTLAKILVGLYTPTEGKVLLDNLNFEQLNN